MRRTEFRHGLKRRAPAHMVVNAVTEEITNVGSVSRQHYEQIVAEPRPTSASATLPGKCCFRLRLMHPEITIVWADAAYAGALVEWAKTYLRLTIKTISRPKNAVGFVLLPRRWVVERSLGRIMHARRHARDYERLPQHSEALITWAAITLMTRRLTRPGPLADRSRHVDAPHASDGTTRSAGTQAT